MARKRTLKKKKQHGGFTKEEIDGFFEGLTTPLRSGYYFLSDFEHLRGEYFEQDPGERHGIHIKEEWHDVVRNGYNSKGYTALYMVCRSGSNQMRHMVLKVEGLDVNAKNNRSGSTPAMGACWKGEHEVVRFGDVNIIFSELNSYAQARNSKLDLNIHNNIKGADGNYETVWKLLEMKEAAGLLKL